MRRGQTPATALLNVGIDVEVQYNFGVRERVDDRVAARKIAAVAESIGVGVGTESDEDLKVRVVDDDRLDVVARNYERPRLAGGDVERDLRSEFGQ